MEGSRGWLVLLSLLLLGCGDCLGAASASSRDSYSAAGSFESSSGTPEPVGHQPVRRSSFHTQGHLYNAAWSLQDTSNLAEQHQQQLHVQHHSAAPAAAATPAISWGERGMNSKTGFQASGSRRRLAQSLWDVVGSLLQQAQQQVQHAHSSRQLATTNNSFEQQLYDMPGDPTAGDHVLQPLEPLLAWPSFGDPQQPSQQPDSSFDGSTADSDNLRGPVKRGGPAKLELHITFAAMGSSGTSLRLPLPPRSFAVAVQVVSNPSSRFDCVTDLDYQDQVVTCPGLELQKDYVVILADEQDNSLELVQKRVRTSNSGVTIEPLQVKLGMVQAEASFGSLAWARGMYYPKARIENTAIVIHAQIVGAQVVVYTKGQPNSIWDMQWTGDDGTASFFLVPNSQQFIANMSVGDTQLESSGLSFTATPGQPSNNRLSQPPQLQLLTAAPKLLCTGEVEDVRGESGQFPANLTAQQDTNKAAIYHPRGFFCRWELLPDYPQLTLTVDYSSLLPDESITLYLAPSNVIQLRQPSKPEQGGVFQTTVSVERSIFVEFQTTRNSTSQVGAFSVSWTSSSPRSRSFMDSRTMVVVLSCVSAAGAVLAAFCFYCMCCSRRRRGAVVVDTSVVQHVSLLRVPSSVRELLPSKPYQPPPPDNPLPGAATEPDCCSICLVELEAGELLTVLPCMHFYHKECINSWLRRNCTCPLCKANVIHGFANTPAGSNNITQQVQRSRRRHRHQRAGSAAAGSDADAAGDGGSSEQQQAATDADATAAGAAAGLGAAAEIELAHAPAGARAGGTIEQQADHLRAVYPVVFAGSAEGSAGSGSSSPTAASGDAIVTLQLPDGPAAAAGLKRSGSSATNSDEAAAIERSGRGPLSMSPAASLGTLQSGTVQASPADFAAAAAAAAAALAAAAAGMQEEVPEGAAAAAAHSGAVTPPGAAAGTLGGAMSAAQASVSALRGSSWVWGRRLQGLMWAPSGSSAPDVPAAAAVGGGAAAGAGATASGSTSHHIVDLPPPSAAGDRQAGGTNNSRSSGRAAARTQEQMLTMLPAAQPGRAAVSIYAYAGNPQALGSGAGEQAQAGPELQGIVVESAGHSLARRQQQQLVRHEGSQGLGWLVGEAGSSSNAGNRSIRAAGGNSSSNSDSEMLSQQQQQDGTEDGESGTAARRSFSLPGAIV